MAPSTYYAARDRSPSARTLSDAVLSVELYSLWMKNRRVYGVRKLCKTGCRAGISIGRDQTARLMRSLGIEDLKHSRWVKTTKPDLTAVRHPELVRRDFTATAPNQLWTTHLTFAPTWAGVAYVCLLVDAFSRMIVGWSASPT